MTSLDVDILSVRLIYAKGTNQVLPANNILTTDGLGGTRWVSISSINAGLSFNTITTSASTFKSSPGNTTFSILDSSNIGLIPTNNGSAATLYSKSFGQIDIPGQSSINSFNSQTGQFNNRIGLNASGNVSISTNTLTNQVYFYSPNDAISSVSSLIVNMNNLNSTMTASINSFNSPFSTFIYNSFSSFSTALGPTVTTLTFASTLSTNTSANFFTNTLYTSTLNISGNRQPFIQYGSGSLTGTSSLITLNSPYINSNYIIQMTYRTGLNTFTVPLSFSSVTTSNFIARGDSNATVFHWTTYGNLF